MRKYITGFLVGVLLASAVPAYGAVTSAIGKKVGSEIVVKLDDKEVGKAIVVDGRSYLPVRATADALDLGLEVTKEAINLVSTEPIMIKNDNFDKMQLLQGSIEIVKGRKDAAIKSRDQLKEWLAKPFRQLDNAKASLESYTDKTVPQYQLQFEAMQALQKIQTDTEAEVAELGLMIADYDRQIADLEAQKAALESK